MRAGQHSQDRHERSYGQRNAISIANETTDDETRIIYLLLRVRENRRT